MTYIGKIKSIDELHYYFDIGKITDVNVIKNRFKNVFENNAEDIFNKNKNLFMNININATSKIDSWQKLKAVAQDQNIFNSLIANKIIKLD